MYKTIVSAIAIAIALPAAAESVVVSTHDLDLASTAGMERLERRIASAARQVCDDNGSGRSVRERLLVRACVARAKATTISQVAALDRSPRRGG
ncbi:MAG: UrcA family protein [Altererythrobacter sp.]|nr:UrcA family protein [Altererythrobacter sp.]